MAPPSGTAPQRGSNRTGNDGMPTRRPTLTDAILGRAVPVRRASNELNDRAAVTAELRRERAKANRQSIDLGKPLGPYDTNSVRDRVRQWQAQGGGVIEQLDPAACAPEEAPASSDTGTKVGRKQTPRKASRPAVADEVDLGDRGNKSRKARVGEVNDADGTSGSRGSSSAPRKRLISDGHWVKPKGSPPKIKAGKGSESPKKAPSSMPADDGIRITPIRGSAARRRLQQEISETTPSKTSVGDDGIRVYSTPSKRDDRLRPKKSVDGTRRSSGSRRGEMSDEEGPPQDSSSPPRETRSDSRRKKTSEAVPMMSGGLGPEDPSKRRRPSRTTAGNFEKSPRSSDAAETVERRKSKSGTPKAGILREVYDGGKKIFSKPDTSASPQIPENRIEAWLSDTPDPFVDGPMPALDPLSPNEPFEFNEIPERVELVGEEHPNEDRTRSDDVGSRVGSGKHRRVRSSRNRDTASPVTPGTASPDERRSRDEGSGAESLGHDEPASSSASAKLKRTGAMRSPASPTRSRRKSSPLKETFTGTPWPDSAPPVSAFEQPQPTVRTPPRQGPDAMLKRPFPTTGRHQLSTIASVETFGTTTETAPTEMASEVSQNTVTANVLDGEKKDASDQAASQAMANKTGLKRRLTTHADLISVLSLPKAGTKSIRSARSIRTNRSRPGKATIADLMVELATDETKYMRELNTLVDGVIPVLLTCVLSKSDSAVAAGLFNPSADNKSDPNLTRPIVDMGIALERLKSFHKRIPQDDPQHLLRWAQGAQKVYKEYLKSWRMGFQDVVVNLAPATDADSQSPRASSVEDETGLPRNADGDVINVDGERVDVAFLLKRPLVRLKYLAKTFKGINLVRPSILAEEQARAFQNLVDDARQRANDERARLEDEGAANIDPTRARDPRTLAPMTGVTIDRSRRVRARDYFGLDLQHSSGQRVDCRVELLLRDDAAGQATGGDLLICEVDTTSRWLLFPPITAGMVSARNGDLLGEIVIMIRGLDRHEQEWHELFSLQTGDEQAGFEWVQMLGLTPVPPGITRSRSFVSRHEHSRSDSRPTTPLLASSATSPGKMRTPSPREIEVPIGEPARGTALQERQRTELSPAQEARGGDPVDRSVSPVSPPSRMHSKLGKDVSISPPSRKTSARDETLLAGSVRPRDLNEAMKLAGSSSTGLRRTKAKRRSRHADDSAHTSGHSESDSKDTSRRVTLANEAHDERSDPGRNVKSSPLEGRSRDSEDRIPSSSQRLTGPIAGSGGSPVTSEREVDPSPDGGNSHAQRRKSLVPRMELPSMPKLRRKRQSSPSAQMTDKHRSSTAPDPILTEVKPGRGTSDSTGGSPGSTERQSTDLEDPKPPSPPPHRSASPVKLSVSKTLKLGSPTSGGKKISHRRSSSPLKHQYEPSSASESDVSEDSATEKEDDTPFSESSDDEELEDGDAPTPLLPLGALRRFSKVSPKGSIYSLPNGTLTPSQSASQAPYKTVPQQPSIAVKTIASIFSWSDRGSWDSLHPDECSIVITPGLIEAFEMTAAHSNPLTASSNPETAQSPTPDGMERPLVGLELTPLVPLRRGTALDISIRSRPTPKSKITSGNNIMFRSRNPEECEILYGMINQARINNPTYIALQNARGPYGNDYGMGVDRRVPSRASGWWGWGSRKSSYRASSRGAPSLATSESSIGSMATAFSALRRFGAGSRSFNIANSTISSRHESRSTSVYSSSSNSSFQKDGSDTPSDPFKGSPIGLTDAKIRLYQRETNSRWRDMGSARLSITKPPVDSQRHGSSGNDKRVVVKGKTAGEPLLDVCLGESAFERVARTGIALSIWEDVVGPNGEVGQVGAVGGVGARTKVYMIQMKSEAETAYTFSLVGKLRY